MPRTVGGSRRFRRGGPGTRGMSWQAQSQKEEDNHHDHHQMESPSVQPVRPLPVEPQLPPHLSNELDTLLEQSTHAIFHKQSWKKHYKRLKKFYKKHGHGNVPLFERRGDSLGMWLELQRQRVQELGYKKAFRNKKYGEKLLELLGPDWWKPKEDSVPSHTNPGASKTAKKEQQKEEEEEDVFEWKEEEHPAALRQTRIRVEDLQWSGSDSEEDECLPAVRKRKKHSVCDQSTAATEPCSSTASLNPPDTSVLDQELKVDLEHDNSGIWSFIEDEIPKELITPNRKRCRGESNLTLGSDARPRAESNVSFGFDPDLFPDLTRNDCEPLPLATPTNNNIPKNLRSDSLAWAKGFWNDHSTPPHKNVEVATDTAIIEKDKARETLIQPKGIDLQEEEIPVKDWL